MPGSSFENDFILFVTQNIVSLGLSQWCLLETLLSIVPEECWFGQLKYSTPNLKSSYAASVAAFMFFIFPPLTYKLRYSSHNLIGTGQKTKPEICKRVFQIYILGLNYEIPFQTTSNQDSFLNHS